MRKRGGKIGTKIPVSISSGNENVSARLRAMDRARPHAVLATESGGRPYASIVAYVLTPDLKGAVFATPKNTRKYRNIVSNPNVALLMDTRTNTPDDLMEAEAVTMTGVARPVRRGRRRDELSGLLVGKHPLLRDFAEASTTAIVYVRADTYVHVSGFQRITRWSPDEDAGG